MQAGEPPRRERGLEVEAADRAVDDDMREMIHSGVSEQELARHARKSTPSIRADGRRQVLKGTTTLEEVLRVTRED